jgi:hypothetical protein
MSTAESRIRVRSFRPLSVTFQPDRRCSEEAPLHYGATFHRVYHNHLAPGNQQPLRRTDLQPEDRNRPKRAAAPVRKCLARIFSYRLQGVQRPANLVRSGKIATRKPVREDSHVRRRDVLSLSLSGQRRSLRQPFSCPEAGGAWGALLYPGGGRSPLCATLAPCSTRAVRGHSLTEAGVFRDACSARRWLQRVKLPPRQRRNWLDA